MPLYDTHKASTCVAPATKCWPSPTVYKFAVPPLWPECITKTPYILNNSLWWWEPQPPYKNASKDSQEFHFWNPAQYGIVSTFTEWYLCEPSACLNFGPLAV